MIKKLVKEWKWEIIFGAGIILLAFFLRSYSLTRLPIFADEAIYVRWAQIMRAEPSLRFVPLSDGKQPLYMWMVIPFFKVIKDPLLAGRFLSVIMGMGTLVGVFLLTYLLFKNKKAAAVAGLVYAISPFSVFFDRMALVDSMLTFFGVWTLVLGILTAKTKRLDCAMLTGFALGGGLLTKSPAIFFVLLLPFTWLLANWTKSAKGKLGQVIKLLLLYGISLLIGYGLYNILRLGTNWQMIAIRNKDYIYPLTHFFSSPLDPFKSFILMVIEWFWTLGPGIILVLAGLGIGFTMKKFPKEILVLSVWFLGPILVQSEFAKAFTARYIFFSIPTLFILAASPFVLHKDIVKKIATVLLIFFVFLALKNDYYFLTDPEKANLPRSERSGYLEDWTSGTGIKEVGDFIRQEYLREPNKKIVVGTEGYFGTLPDGLQIYLNDLREITVIGVGIDLKEIPQSLLESKKAGNKTYLVINSTRFFGNPEKLGLQLLAVYPKAVKPGGARETLLFFEVTPSAIFDKPQAIKI